LEHLQIIVYVLFGTVVGTVISSLVPRVLKRFYEKRDVGSITDIRSHYENSFKGFKSFELRFAFKFYRNMADRWEDRGKTLAGFSGILLALIVPITVEFLLDYPLAAIIALVSAFCFLLGSLISSLYLIYPKGARWGTCEEAISYYHYKAETLDRMITTAFLFFMSGVVLIFILLLSIKLT